MYECLEALALWRMVACKAMHIQLYVAMALSQQQHSTPQRGRPFDQPRLATVDAVCAGVKLKGGEGADRALWRIGDLQAADVKEVQRMWRLLDLKQQQRIAAKQLAILKLPDPVHFIDAVIPYTAQPF